MNLKNDFSQYAKSLFADMQPFCTRCGSNRECAVHHIYGRKSASMLNGITLCGRCHAWADCYNAGGIAGTGIRRGLLLLTLRAFYRDDSWELWLPQRDAERNREFLESIREDFLAVADKVRKCYN